MAKGGDVRYGRRRKLMDHTRDLARSGEHADHRSIIAHLAATEDAALIREWLDARSFHAQAR
jgi:hypothetical protein